MFSKAEKNKIAGEIERLLLSFNHPEMPTENPDFTLKVSGKSVLSWAEIKPNWQYDKSNPPAVNPWNERQSTI